MHVQIIVSSTVAGRRTLLLLLYDVTAGCICCGGNHSNQESFHVIPSFPFDFQGCADGWRDQTSSCNSSLAGQEVEGCTCIWLKNSRDEKKRTAVLFMVTQSESRDIRVVFSSVGRAAAPCIEATVLTAGIRILHGAAPSCMSFPLLLSLLCFQLKAKIPK